MHLRSQTFARVFPGIALAALLAPVTALAGGTLRVCADPNNLPFSNGKREGFENKIAEVIAKDQGATVSYTWLKQRQSFLRQTLNANRCDVVIGLPTGFDRVLGTQPYYRSSYVVVTQRRRHLQLKSYDDPALKGLKIGLHSIGNDGANSPPAVALGRHGLAGNIVGFSMWGEHTVKNPQGRIVEAVAQGQIDMAIVWGPLGGYFAKQYGDALAVAPAPTDPGMPNMPFSFDISMAVRKDDAELAAKLETSLERHRRDIAKVLSAYHIPIEPDSGSSVAQLGADSRPVPQASRGK